MFLWWEIAKVGHCKPCGFCEEGPASHRGVEMVHPGVCQWLRLTTEIGKWGTARTHGQKRHRSRRMLDAEIKSVWQLYGR